MSLLENEPIEMFIIDWLAINIGSFENGALPLIEIPFQTDSPPNENGAELLSMIVHTAVIDCILFSYL